MRKLDEQKRSLIIKAATGRFLRYGLKKTSMAEIARDVDLAVGTLYLYFPKKDDLLVECVNDCKQSHDVFIRKILGERGPVKNRLRKYVLHRFHQDQENRQSKTISATLQNHILELLPEKRKEEKELMVRVVTALLEEAIAKGEMRVMESVTADVFVFMQAIRGYFPLARYVSFVSEPEEKDLLAVINWFLKIWNVKS